MTLFLDLDTDGFTVDPKIMECIPYSLAAYYQAIPLAREGYQVSVVMAHPENETALAVLGSLLEAQIVPVHASPEAILAALMRLYPPQAQVAPKILTWSMDPALTGTVGQLAAIMGRVLDIPPALLQAPAVDLDKLLTIAREGPSVLTVLNLPAHQTPHLLAQSATPLLLVRGRHLELKRILMVWRGFSSDNSLIHWMIPLVHQLDCRLTAMPLTEPSPHGLTDLLSANDSARQHIEDCLRQLEAENIEWIDKSITTWGQLLGTAATDPLNVYTRSDSAGAAEQWAKFGGGKTQEDLQGIAVNADPGLAEAVRQDKFGVGYNNIGFAYDPKTGQPNTGLKIIPIDLNGDGQISADEDFYGARAQITQAIATETYPFPPARVLYLVTKGEPTPVINTFYHWVLTDGQAFVSDAGYVHLPESRLQEALNALPK
jgi:hypothetical protein